MPAFSRTLLLISAEPEPHLHDKPTPAPQHTQLTGPYPELHSPSPWLWAAAQTLLCTHTADKHQNTQLLSTALLKAGSSETNYKGEPLLSQPIMPKEI